MARRPDDSDVRARTGRGSSRPGFTLIELLVVLGVVGLLASLILPAVQAARSAAARAACGNNLRQIALALHSYHASQNVFPSASGLPNHGAGRSIVTIKQFSAFSRITPFLDAADVYNNTNFSTNLTDFYIFTFYNSGDPWFNPNLTVMGTTLGVLLCPGDARGEGAPTAGTNYRVNLGADRWSTLVDSPLNGPLMSYRSSPAADVTDGLAHTALLSEKLRGRMRSERPDPRRDMIAGGLGAPYTAQEALAACRGRRGAPDGFFPTAGLCWLLGTLSHTCYNHVVDPNGSDPDCVLPRGNPVAGIVGARGNHAGGVQAAMADGSVRFVSNSIQSSVWRAIGTRAGNEVVQGGDF